MKRIVVRIAFAVALVGLGWSVGRAQSVRPDFELIVNAPSGEITLECKRGCGLTFAEQQLVVPRSSAVVLCSLRSRSAVLAKSDALRSRSPGGLGSS